MITAKMREKALKIILEFIFWSSQFEWWSSTGELKWISTGEIKRTETKGFRNTIYELYKSHIDILLLKKISVSLRNKTHTASQPMNSCVQFFLDLI